MRGGEIIASAGFVATSLVAVWAAYDRRSAWSRFALITAGVICALAIAWTGRRGGEKALAWIASLCALLAGAIGLYFLLTYNWSEATKFAALRQLGLWVQDHRPNLPLSEDVNANVAGSALALLFPIGLGALVWTRARRRYVNMFILGVALAIAFVALVLSGSRGAWIGLAAGGIAVAFIAWWTRGEAIQRDLSREEKRAASPRPYWILIAGIALLLGGITWVAVSSLDLKQLLGSVGGVGGSAMSRVDLWRYMISLVADYPFTGSGLGSTMMAFSTYVLLLHVGYVAHAHNLFLQIAVEQGLPGAIAFIGLVVVAIPAPPPSVTAQGVATSNSALPVRSGERVFRLAAVASLVVLLVHGLVDSGLYVSRIVPIVFLPLGFSLATKTHIRGLKLGCWPDVNRWSRGLAVVAIVVAIVVLLPPVRSAYQANLGAVAQTRAELAVYQWPQWPIQDALRRSPQVDLSRAIQRYQAALVLSPHNASANRRLGQIELSRGDYTAARQHLEAALAADPGQRATRQLLGEAYAIAGDVEPAAGLWQTIDVSLKQLDLRQWWYNDLGENQRADWIAKARALATGAASQPQR